MAGPRAPKVSVVTVYHNGANFLAEAADSMLPQTLGDWEYLLVDDGSTDVSPAIAADFAARDPRVRCLAQPGGINRGLAAGKAIGADAARGDYLLFLDHDDVLYPEALASLVAALDAHPAAGLAFAGCRFWKYDPAVPDPDGELRYRRFAGRVLPGRWMLRDLLWSDARHPASCATLLRREAYLAARGPGAPWEGMYEDTAMLLRLLAAHDVYLLGGVVAAYRMHGGSMCQQARAAGTHSAAGPGKDRSRFLRWVHAELPLDPLSRAVLALARLRSGGG